MHMDTQDIWEPPTLSAWSTQQIDAPKWIIPGLVPAESKVVLTGHKKRAMKSHLGLAFGIAIYTGRGANSLIPHEDFSGESVLIIQEESTRAETVDRCRALCRGVGVELETGCHGIHFAFHERIKLDSVDWQHRILTFIHRKRPVLVICDPWYKLHTADENKGAEVMPILDFLEEIRVRGPTRIRV